MGLRIGLSKHGKESTIGGTVKRVYSTKNVLEAAKERISWAFDTFPKIYCSFSGGKDSTVMTHLVMEEAKGETVKSGSCSLTGMSNH